MCVIYNRIATFFNDKFWPYILPGNNRTLDSYKIILTKSESEPVILTGLSWKRFQKEDATTSLTGQNNAGQKWRNFSNVKIRPRKQAVLLDKSDEICQGDESLSDIGLSDKVSSNFY